MPDELAAAAADKQMETAIANMLRTGVLISASVVVVGGVLYLLRAPQAVPDYAHFHGTPITFAALPGIFGGVARFDPASIIVLGILILIATPILRVAFCVFGFAAQRDHLYTAISLLVLAILTFSLLHPQ